MKLHDILHRPALAAQRESADVSTSTDATIRHSSPVGGDGHDDSRYNKMKELEEFFDLLASVKGTAFARFMLGVDGDLSVFQDTNGNLEGCEDLEETRREGVDEEEEGGDTPEHLRPGLYNDHLTIIVTLLNEKYHNHLGDFSSGPLKGWYGIGNAGKTASHYTPLKT